MVAPSWRLAARCRKKSWRISAAADVMLENMSETDLDLLARYARHHAEDAFAEIVRRHLDLVHSAALRQVRSPQLAEEVAQSAFLKLARHARQLAPGTIVSAWLYQVTRREAIDVVRREARRHLREQIATEMNAINATAADWTGIEPLLDEAMHDLDETDRAAVLLRYFEEKSLREVGQALGASENAAQKRLTRAVERLREFFGKRGVTVGARGLVVAISANAVQAAPVGLAVTISATAALAGTTLAATATATATKAIAMTTLQKAVVTATVAILAGAGVYQARRASQLREQVQTLQQQQAPLTEQIEQLRRERDDALKRVASLFIKPTPRLPAPRIQVASPPEEDLRSTNLYERFKDKQLKLAVEQVESYLKANGRNAASLLAAYRTTGDSALLDEAMQKFPSNPQVAFEAAFKKDAAPEDRRRWLDAFKESDPDNALANYLSALDYFKSGQPDQAVQEFIAASGKPFQDYTSERYQDDAEAYLAAGYSVADAKTASSLQLLLPQLAQVKELGLNMIELAKSYRQAGDDVSAEAALQMTISLGQRYSTPSPGEATISQLVGIVLEGIALKAMDPNSPHGSNGQTVRDRVDHLVRERAELEERSRQVESLFPKMSEHDWISYKDRWLMFGEAAAASWLLNKYGQK